MDILLELLLNIIATEALTNLLTKSEFSIRFIKKPLFNWRRFKVFSFIHDMLDCSYCTSVWVACFIAFLYLTNNSNLVVLVLVFHRLSNVLHFIIDWIDEKRPRDLDFTSKGEDYERLREEHDTPVVAHDEKNSGPRSENSSG